MLRVETISTSMPSWLLYGSAALWMFVVCLGPRGSSLLPGLSQSVSQSVSQSRPASVHARIYSHNIQSFSPMMMIRVYLMDETSTGTRCPTLFYKWHDEGYRPTEHTASILTYSESEVSLEYPVFLRKYDSC